MDNKIAQNRNSYLAELDAAFQDFISMTEDLDAEIMDMLFEKECADHDAMMLDLYH